MQGLQQDLSAPDHVYLILLVPMSHQRLFVACMPKVQELSGMQQTNPGDNTASFDCSHYYKK